jgi:hypothetical protein
MGSKEILCEDMDRIHLAQGNVHGNRLLFSVKREDFLKRRVPAV